MGRPNPGPILCLPQTDSWRPGLGMDCEARCDGVTGRPWYGPDCTLVTGPWDLTTWCALLASRFRLLGESVQRCIDDGLQLYRAVDVTRYRASPTIGLASLTDSHHESRTIWTRSSFMLQCCVPSACS
jgi:hypothetical protein